jgi:hypothetical protein
MDQYRGTGHKCFSHSLPEPIAFTPFLQILRTDRILPSQSSHFLTLVLGDVLVAALMVSAAVVFAALFGLD